MKVGLWLLLATPSKSLWVLMALCVPDVGVKARWRLHACLDERALCHVCHAILVVTAAKLLWERAGRIRPDLRTRL